jgi:hypothetical protein
MAFFLNRFSGAFSLWGMVFSSLFPQSFFWGMAFSSLPRMAFSLHHFSGVWPFLRFSGAFSLHHFSWQS